MKFSANLGFLWNERPLPDAIRAAAAAGFDAVECHWPNRESVSDVKLALKETGLPMISLNTSRGHPEKGDNGLSALPDRKAEAQNAIDEAIWFAKAFNAGSIHVMAGVADGEAAQKTFLENLHYACSAASQYGITVLIEPLNRHDAPGYFLKTTEQAASLIENVTFNNIKMMFDCYHIQLMQGDISNRLEKFIQLIGHIQFASVPDRGPPDHGELDYRHVFDQIEKLGYKQALGAEYSYQGETEQSLDWLQKYKRPAQ